MKHSTKRVGIGRVVEELPEIGAVAAAHFAHLLHRGDEFGALVAGCIRYSIVTMTGPLSGSGVSASTGAAQSIDGVKSSTS